MGYQGKGSLGRVINNHVLLLPPLVSNICSRFFVVTKSHNAYGSCCHTMTTSSFKPLSLAVPFKYCYSFTRLTQTLWCGIQENFEQDNV